MADEQAPNLASVMTPQAPPDLGGNPDMPSLAPQDPSQGGGVGDGATQPNPSNDGVHRQSRLSAILSGIAHITATGLAGSAGAKNFGQGLAGGAKAELEQQQQDLENAQKKQIIDSNIRFQTAQAANLVVETSLRDAQLHALPQQQQDAHNAASLEQLKSLQELGITPTLVIPNTTGGGEAKAGMEQLTASHGGVPPMFTINVGHQIIGFDLNQLTQAPQGLDQVNKMRSVQGLPPIDPKLWAQTPKPQQIQTVNAALNFGNPDPSEQTLAQYNNYLATAKAMPEGPEKDARVAQLQGIVSRTKSTLDAVNKRSNEQLAAKTTAEEQAKQPFALAKVRAEQAIKDGDPNSAADLLVNGDVAPSQIISSRNPRFAQQAFAAAKKKDPNWNSQKAEADFKVASSPTNVTFFGSARSLTDKGGTLDQLEANYKKLGNGQFPVFNKYKDLVEYQAGDPALAGFRQTLIGAADDYAKVMGGGTGTDSARNEIIASLSNAMNKGQMGAAVQSARDAVMSQQESRIGNNTVMRRMYGSEPREATPPAPSVPAGATMKVPGSDGKLHWSDGKSDLGVVQ
jgi:hypothetical protein